MEVANQQGSSQKAAAGSGAVPRAWDCDNRCAIAAEKEAEIFEEVADMTHPFEGIPTVGMRKDMDRMAFFCNGCRYLVTAYPDWTAARVKEALMEGGIERANPPPARRHTPGIRTWEDLELIYAGQIMDNDRKLSEYRVPPGCRCLIAIEGAKLRSGKPDMDSAYWL
ncbi:unnamed protein product [Pedinophyceae sp. YPF-701]|nr:unnamed protein product [Pedinophyceae sp. YPF-701]